MAKGHCRYLSWLRQAVLGLEECIVAFRGVYCCSEAYPEDIPIFDELGDLAQVDVALAAGFMLSYVSIYSELLQEALSYVESSLARLAEN